MRNKPCRMMGVGWMVVSWSNHAGRRSRVTQHSESERQPRELVMVTCASSTEEAEPVSS